MGTAQGESFRHELARVNPDLSILILHGCFTEEFQENSIPDTYLAPTAFVETHEGFSFPWQPIDNTNEAAELQAWLESRSEPSTSVDYDALANVLGNLRYFDMAKDKTETRK